MNFPGFSPGDLTQRELFDSAVVALSMSSQDGTYIAVNAAYARLFGYDSPEALMADARSAHRFYVDLEDRTRWLEAIRSNDQMRDLEVKLRRRDGALFWASMGISAIKDAGGEVIAYHAALYDITEARALRDDRQRAERLLRLEHAVSLALTGAQAEPEGVRNVIRAVCEANGWMAGRFFCAGPDGLLSYREGWCTDDPAAREYIAQSRTVSYRPGEGLTGLVWQSGEPLWSANVPGDARATGRMLGVNRGGAMVLPVSWQGERLGVLSFVRAEPTDPDEHLLQALGVMAGQVGQFVSAKRAEAVLRESEARFRGLVALSSDWYWEQDEEFRFTRFSGDTAGVAIGKRRWELGLEPISQTWDQHRAALQAHEPFRGFEYSRICEDGSTRYVEVNGEPVFDAEGRFRGYRGLATEITLRKREETLARLEQRVTLRFAQATSVGEALRGAIRAICETERWEAGRYLQVDDARNVLSDRESWGIDAPAVRKYLEESRGLEYAPGEGLVGRVWQTGEPLWVPDITVDARVRRPHLAIHTGMHGSVAFPVHADGRSIGVFIFDSREIRKPDTRLLRTLGIIGGQVGQLIRRAQAEEAMRESEERFRGLTALSADWYWEQDASLRLAFMSQQMGEKTGLPPGAYLGQHRWDAPALNLSEADWAAHRAQLERHEPFRDFEMQRPDGKGGSAWVSLTGEPVFDAGGGFAGYRGVGKDITERKRADDELRRFRLAVDQSADMMALVDSETMLYLDVNDTMCKALGYSRDELLAMHPYDLLPLSRDELARSYRSIIDGPGSAALVSEYRRRDGSIMPIESFRSVIRSGGRALIVAVARDIGERLAKEGALRRMTRMYAALSSLNEAIPRASDPRVLLQEACEIVASSGDFVRVAVRLLDKEAGRTRAVAWSGPGSQELAHFSATIDPAFPEGRSVVAEALRTGETRVSNDFLNDPRTYLIRGTPAAEGTRSVGAFPLRPGGRVGGVLILHGREPDAFDGDMGLLLDRMADNISFGLGHLESESRFRQTFELAATGIAHVGTDRRFIRVNRRLCEMLGYGEAELVGMTGRDISHPEDKDIVNELRAKLYAREIDDVRVEKRYLRKDGSTIWVALTAALARDADGTPSYEILVIEDISARKRAEQALRGIVQASAEPLLLVRMDGTTQFVNPAAETLFGRTAQELEGAMLGLPLADGRPAEVEIVLPGGGVRPAEMQFASTELEGQELLVVSLHDLSERKRYEQHIEHLANHDALTSLPNRTLLRDRVEQAIVHAKRNGGHVGLMFVDLDQFKLVNDSWGHAAGDSLLLEVARRLQLTVRDGDTVARLGGDEFVVLLPDLARADNTSVVARKVAETLEKPVLVDGRELRLTASIGIALFPDDGDDLDTLLQCADAAMYRAKDAGRNGYQYYSADMGAQARTRVETEAGLRLALSRDELRLHYQPQVDLANGEVKGFEALMRWEHPARGVISPADFIPVAEESGLIIPMGEWALLSACREAMAWNAAGLGNLMVAVNLSPRQFWRGSVTDAVRNALAASGLAPAQLEVEITESVVARDLQNVMLQLEQLRRMGVSIAIDDFGTGYSSLAYLRSLPINKLKIDKSFIKGIPGDREATALVTEIVRLAHILSLEVVAEGVETPAQAALLRQAGCEAMQGYLFARPMPAADCPALLRSGRRLTLHG